MEVSSIRGVFTNAGLRIMHLLKQRLAALFFVVLMFFGAAGPSIEAYALTANNQPSASDIANRAQHKTSTTPSIGTINYKSPAVPQALTSSIPSAEDANTPGGGAGSALLSTIRGGVSSPAVSAPDTGVKTFTSHELTNGRTATSSLQLNSNGTVTKTNYFSPHFYQNSGSWDNIDTSLIPDNNAADSGNVFGKAFGVVESWLTSNPTAFIEKANSWQARFTPSDFSLGMVRIKEGNSHVGFSPVNANSVNPVISTTSSGVEIVKYDNLWTGVNVEYLIESDQVKEAISLVDKSAASQVQFKILGADLQSPQAGNGNKCLVFRNYNITSASTITSV